MFHQGVKVETSLVLSICISFVILWYRGMFLLCDCMRNIFLWYFCVASWLTICWLYCVFITVL